MPFSASREGEDVARYAIKNQNDLNSLDFNQVSVFATILKTMYMFEEADTLGRPLTWAFDGPQLLVIPARVSGQTLSTNEKLTAFSFPLPTRNQSRQARFTSLSHDIVCHETGHAILDGISPISTIAFLPRP